MIDSVVDLDSRVGSVFADAGCAGWVHARVLDPSRPLEYGFGAHEPVVLASVYKVHLFTALCRMADAGELDLAETVTVDPARCAVGPTGIAAFTDPVTLSWRDLATSMMVVSDNAAADVILRRVTAQRVATVLEELGLASTRIVDGVAEVHARLMSETGTSTVDEAFAALVDPAVERHVTAYDAAYTSSSTPADCTRLLAQVWADRAASAVSCDRIRRVMRRQALRGRIPSGFPYPGVRVAGKTGTVGIIRNEIAVVEFPRERPVAVAVFTKSARTDLTLPVVDAAIGQIAHDVVTWLRVPVD